MHVSGIYPENDRVAPPGTDLASRLHVFGQMYVMPLPFFKPSAMIEARYRSTVPWSRTVLISGKLVRWRKTCIKLAWTEE